MSRTGKMNSPAWLDMCGVTDPSARARYLAMEFRHSGRPEPKPRVISQAALDAQPAKRTKAKAEAAPPTRGSKAGLADNATQPRLL